MGCLCRAYGALTWYLISPRPAGASRKPGFGFLGQWSGQLIPRLGARFWSAFTRLNLGGCDRQRSVTRGVWQPKPTNHRVRNAADYESHRDYILDNPVRAKPAPYPEDYSFSSASGVKILTRDHQR
ncbi:MAG TPA: hypothetical protein VFY05_08655 [Candidatus Angelobacter sp.]|nr:hypothetical protein [Candidatus Angelobacter sp.]